MGCVIYGTGLTYNRLFEHVCWVNEVKHTQRHTHRYTHTQKKNQVPNSDTDSNIYGNTE